jgi:hypothetical protein
MTDVTRRVFFSFHYDADNWRASQVRNMGVIDGNEPCKDNDWETVKKGGDPAIKKWIDGQINGRSCAVILVGSGTANRKWINYEIIKAWNDGKGVVGIRIHGLKDREQKTSSAGANPFDYITFDGNGNKLSSVVKLHDPTDFWGNSTTTYANIKKDLSKWIEDAIKQRES